MQDPQPTSRPARARPSEPPTDPGIPDRRAERVRLREHVRRYVHDAGLTPPLGMTELLEHARRCLKAGSFDGDIQRYAAVLLSNAVWEDTLAGVPFDRRLLLLPQCLRNPDTCTASIDAYGLTCDACGGCVINEFLAEADRLGYVTLVAEGSALVMSLIETGQVEAIIGVSCLSALEQVFPYMEAGAVPGLAIPLLHDGCENTHVDTDWVWQAIYLSSGERGHRQNLESLRREVDAWFTPQALAEALGAPATQAERIAHDWLARAGKRWRPVLLVAAWEALAEPDSATDIPPGVAKLALAVECFHKASLIHDDIEDDDALRYGRQSLHAAHGVPVALNVGDLLIGEGYRLIGECADVGMAADVVGRMLAVAADGHRTLCLGQGDDLDWAKRRGRISVERVLDIVRRKTAPPFEVALRLGCLAAGEGESQLIDVLQAYSRAVGIAYQVRDDLHDLHDADGAGDLAARRASVLIALAGELAEHDPAAGKILQPIWHREPLDEAALTAIRQMLRQLDVESHARTLLDGYKQQALAAVARLDSPTLKALLRRLIGKIFYDVETMTCLCESPDRQPPSTS